MIDFLRGEVARVGPDAAVIEVGGVGLRIQMPVGDLAGLRGAVTVYTVLNIRDDDVHLYGFLSERARRLFRALTSVSGVGPKIGLALLGRHAPEPLEHAIVAGDAGALSLVPGVGGKTAQRIILELRDKLGLGEVPIVAGPLADVRAALEGLGYSSTEIARAVGDLPADGDATTLLRHALRALQPADP